MSLVFFSFVALPDAGPAELKFYNDWQVLDHRPENLALDGVEWGDRWGRPADFREAAQSAPGYADTDFVTMYWLNDPVEESLQEWFDLGESSVQWGRGPHIPGVERRFRGFFRPVLGYSAPSSLVDARVLKYRPNRGVHLTFTHYVDHHGVAAHDHFAWEDRVLMPRLMGVDGVAGAWTFSYDHWVSDDNPGNPEPASLRARVVYFDDEPLATAQRMQSAIDELTADGAPEAGEVVFSGTLKTLLPWVDLQGTDGFR